MLEISKRNLLIMELKLRVQTLAQNCSSWVHYRTTRVVAWCLDPKYNCRSPAIQTIVYLAFKQMVEKEE